jgi:hypothetical protein
MTTTDSAALTATLPIALPARADGAPLEHLSATSLSCFWQCPEAFRRRYLLGERGPVSAEMLRGRVVDAAVSAYYRAVLDRGRPPAASDSDEELERAWRAELDEPRDEIDWGDWQAAALKDSAVAALRAYLAQLAPTVQPVAVQRRFELRLNAALQWSIVGYVDLEDAAGDVIDLKVKRSHLTQPAADAHPQASLYLLERALTGAPGRRFVFHSVCPTAREKVRAVQTTRTRGQLQAHLARVAATARAIDALARQLGRDCPWPLADPASWKCSPRYCPHFAGCQGGLAGLPRAA